MSRLEEPFWTRGKCQYLMLGRLQQRDHCRLKGVHCVIVIVITWYLYHQMTNGSYLISVYTCDKSGHIVSCVFHGHVSKLCRDVPMWVWSNTTYKRKSWSRVGVPPWSSSSVLDHRSLPPVFKSCCGLSSFTLLPYLWRSARPICEQKWP